MELRHLRYFVGVGEEQHFGRAAKRLFIVQPALSRQIQDLERELGFPLFERLPRGVKLNAAGKLFLDDARRILKEIDDAKRRAEWVAHGKAGTLRIGIATAVSWHGPVADFFRQFRRRQPDAQLELHHLLSIHQVEAILSGRLDVGFAATLTPWHKDLAHWEFARDKMVLAVPKGHPLTKRKMVRLRDLRSMPFDVVIGEQRKWRRLARPVTGSALAIHNRRDVSVKGHRRRGSSIRRKRGNRNQQATARIHPEETEKVCYRFTAPLHDRRGPKTSSIIPAEISLRLTNLQHSIRLYVPQSLMFAIGPDDLDPVNGGHRAESEMHRHEAR